MHVISGVFLSISLVFSQAFCNTNTIPTHRSHIYAYVIKDSQETRSDNSIFDDIDDELWDMNERAEKIKLLLKEKEDIAQKIKNTMNNKVTAKIKLSEDQMLAFKEFSDVYENENLNLRNSLERLLHSKTLIPVQNEILYEDTDFEFVLERIKNVNDQQFEVIYSAATIIEAGKLTLSIL